MIKKGFIVALVFVFQHTYGQDILKNINYFNYRQSEVDIDYFDQIWLTSEDINDDDIEGLVTRAEEKLELGYYNEALADIENALKADSTIPYLFNLKALCLLSDDSLETAKEYFYHASVLDSSDVVSRYYLSTIMVEEEMADTAEILLKEFDKTFPENALIKYALANIYLSQYKTEKAIRYYKRAAELDPEFPEAWYSIGLINFIMFDFYHAERFFEKTIEYNPEFAPAYFMKGFLDLDDKPERSLDYWNKAIELSPDNQYYRLSRGILKLYSENYHEGLEDIGYVIKKNNQLSHVFDDFTEGWQNKAQIDFMDQFFFFTDNKNSLSEDEIELFENYLGLFLIREYTKADELLGKATANAGENALLHLFRGINSEHLWNSVEKTETYYQLAIQNQPFLYASYLRLGIIQCSLQKFDESVESFNQFLLYNDTTKIVFRYRGISYFHLGNYQAAIDDFDNYFSIDSFDLDLTYHKALCYKNLGSHEKAIEQFNLVLIHDNEDNDSRYHKAECFYLLKQYDSALYTLNQIPLYYFTFNPVAYVLRGKINLSQKNYAGAAFDFDQALAGDPNNTDYLYLASLANKSLKNTKELLDIYNRMLAIDSHLAEIYYLRSMVYFTLGKTENGCKDLDSAFENGYLNAQKAKEVYCQE